MDDTEGFQCLVHSNWTICNPLSQFCSDIFPTLDFHTGECQFLITPESQRLNRGDGNGDWWRGWPLQLAKKKGNVKR